MDDVRPQSEPHSPDLRHLRGLVDGDVVTPCDDGWDAARQALELTADQQPTAVAVPESVDDVRQIIDFAREEGLRVAPQGTGHGASALGDLHETILIKLHRLRGVEIDPAARSARVEAGVLWPTWSRPRPSTTSPRSPARRRTSASSATPSVAGTRWSPAQLGIGATT